ncbi:MULTISPECIES: LysR family transcriptional regulator [unclassified Brevibacterium]|uniref:LysR family transcriptional regulator n=1 Tax=unclassified Brevibacterium TaxID=2614124 RepID=UPI001FF8FAC6|nr:MULTISPECIES: LysR family transcriptional regulator [unclassified Brevibacterium]MCK1803069.1 LysR family transcriptional regulator [Brevibacterium sp. R8603A2]
MAQSTMQGSMNWTLGQLRTFVAVADHGTMTAAARVLGYTPGAVSQHMSALRRVVGTDLVVQSGRGLALTETGQLLLGRARAVLAAEEQAAQAVRGRVEGSLHGVTLGVFGSASVVAFGPAAAKLSGSGISLQAREVDVEVMQSAVLEGRIDVGIGIDYPSSPLAPQRGLLMHTMRSERFGVVAAAHLPDPTVEELAAASWILPRNESTFGRAMRFACAELGFAPRESHIVVDSAVALAMVGSGMGYTLATPVMMSLAPSTARLVPGIAAGGRRIVIMVHERMAEQPAIAHVVDVLGEVFTELSLAAD